MTVDWRISGEFLLWITACYLATIGKEIAPKIPRALPEEESASVGDDGKSVEAVVKTESAMDA